MEKLGAERGGIVAAIGPLIRQHSYEVGGEFVERFMDADAENAVFFIPSAREGHAMFDLAGFIRMRLENAGVLDDRRRRRRYLFRRAFLSATAARCIARSRTMAGTFMRSCWRRDAQQTQCIRRTSAILKVIFVASLP